MATEDYNAINGVLVDTGTYFESVYNYLVAQGGPVVPGSALDPWTRMERNYWDMTNSFLPKRFGEGIAVATGFKVNGIDLNQLFTPVGGMKNNFGDRTKSWSKANDPVSSPSIEIKYDIDGGIKFSYWGGSFGNEASWHTDDPTPVDSSIYSLKFDTPTIVSGSGTITLTNVIIGTFANLGTAQQLKIGVTTYTDYTVKWPYTIRKDNDPDTDLSYDLTLTMIQTAI